MARSWLHQVLEVPIVYRLAQAILAPFPSALYRAYDEVFRSSAGRVLEVGSGPAVETPLPPGVFVGLDVNLAYVRRFTEPLTGEREDCAKLGTVASAAAMPFANGAFDEARSAAVLHHLPDGLALAAVREMVRVVRPGGRVVVFDMVRPDSFLAAPIAWLICRFDRGEWVRLSSEVERITHEAYDGAWQVRTVKYSWYRIRGVFLCLEKPA